MSARHLQADPRRTRTREALLRGGRRVMARKGVEAATVAEIVRAAGVSQPSFYNHFESREALARAIAAEFFRKDADIKQANFDALEDPAEAIALNVCHSLRVAVEDPIVAWVVVRAGPQLNLLSTSDTDRLVPMIENGLRRGRFHDLDPRTAALAIRGAAFPVLHDILRGEAPPDVELQLAALVLRLLGLPRREAAAIVRRIGRLDRRRSRRAA